MLAISLSGAALGGPTIFTVHELWKGLPIVCINFAPDENFVTVAAFFMPFVFMLGQIRRRDSPAAPPSAIRSAVLFRAYWAR